MTIPDNERNPPIDWRSTIITVGATILYTGNGTPKLGVVERMRWSDSIGWTLGIRWTEDRAFHRSLRPADSIGHRLGVSAQVRTFSVTVWPEAPCTCTPTPSAKTTPPGGTTATKTSASEPGSTSAATAT